MVPQGNSLLVRPESLRILLADPHRELYSVQAPHNLNTTINTGIFSPFIKLPSVSQQSVINFLI